MMILSSFKLQNPITARKDKNVRSKNIRRLESGWRRKANPKTLPSRTKEFILDNPLEAAVLGVGGVLGARYLVKGIKASKLNPKVLGANNTVYKNPVVSTLHNAKKAFDDDVVKAKDVWNAITKGKTPQEAKNIKILERRKKINSNLSNTNQSTINNQIKALRNQYIDSEASKAAGKTVYKKGIKKQQLEGYKIQIQALKTKIRKAGQKSGSGIRRKNSTGNVDNIIKDSSYNLKSHLTFF